MLASQKKSQALAKIHKNRVEPSIYLTKAFGLQSSIILGKGLCFPNMKTGVVNPAGSYHII